MKKILNYVIAVAISVSTMCAAEITVGAETNDVILTTSNLNAQTTATHEGSDITIAKGQKAVFDLNISTKTTYDVVIDDITEQAFRTLNYSVSINYGKGDVTKINNVNLQTQPGWITFQAGTTSMTVTNNGENGITFSQIKLTEKVFKADKPIVLPTLNYDADGSVFTTAVGDTNGDARFIAGTNLQRMNVGQNQIIPYYINLEEGGDYYFLVSEKVNADPRFIVSLDGTQKFATTVTKSVSDRDAAYSNLHYVNEIKLNQGLNKLDVKVQAYAYINGFILIKKDKVKNVVGTDLEKMIISYDRDMDLYGGWTVNGSNNLTFYGNSSISFAASTELAWAVDVKRAGNYDIDFIGNYGTNKFDFVVDGITPYVVNFAGNGQTGETIATQKVELTAGLHTFVIRNYTPGVFNGLKFKFADTVSDVTLKASDFNLADGQGDMKGTYGGYYDTTPDKLDAAYYIAEYSPCEFRHPGGDASIDEAIMSTDEWMNYNLFVTEDGWYNVDMTVASEAEAHNATFAVSANNMSVENGTTASTGWNDLQPLHIGRIYLSAGNNVVQIKNTRKGTNFFTDVTFKLDSVYSVDIERGLIDENGETVKTFEAGKAYSVVAYPGSNENAKLYVAGYGEDNSLIKVFDTANSKIKLSSDKSMVKTSPITIPENVEKIGVFLWTNDMVPLCDALKVE